MGELDLAVTHIEDGLAFCRRAACLPELAWSCHDYALTLLQRSGDSDRAKATSLLDESLTISSELGMRPLMERVAELQETLAAVPQPSPAYPNGLTPREKLKCFCSYPSGRQTERSPESWSSASALWRLISPTFTLRSTSETGRKPPYSR